MASLSVSGFAYPRRIRPRGIVHSITRHGRGITQQIQQDVRASLNEVHGQEIALAKGRWTQLMKRRLEAVPEHRRVIVEERLEKLISKSYQKGEKEERVPFYEAT